MVLITAAQLPEVVQLTVGAIVGAALSINMSRGGMSFIDPKTRWMAAAFIVLFLSTFLLLTDLLIN
jgi:hypothetical protein